MMIQFPPTLVPNYIKVRQLPTINRAEFVADTAFFTPSIQLTDTNSGGILELVFESYPTNIVDIPKKDSVLGINRCNLQQLGWVGAWYFFNQTTKCGHLCCEIPATHAMWKQIDYQAIWATLSLNGSPLIWRIKEFNNGNDRTIRQTTNFSMVIHAEIRSPQWTYI